MKEKFKYCPSFGTKGLGIGWLTVSLLNMGILYFMWTKSMPIIIMSLFGVMAGVQLMLAIIYLSVGMRTYVVLTKEAIRASHVLFGRQTMAYKDVAKVRDQNGQLKFTSKAGATLIIKRELLSLRDMTKIENYLLSERITW